MHASTGDLLRVDTDEQRANPVGPRLGPFGVPQFCAQVRGLDETCMAAHENRPAFLEEVVEVVDLK